MTLTPAQQAALTAAQEAHAAAGASLDALAAELVRELSPPPLPVPVWQSRPPLTLDEALARPGTAHPTGLYPTGYSRRALLSDTTLVLDKLVAHSWQMYDSRYNTPECEQECGTARGVNNKAAILGTGSNPSGLVVIGGRLFGDQPADASWMRLKWGAKAEAAVDAGRKWPTDGGSQDGAAVVAGAPPAGWQWFTGQSAHNVMDGVRFQGTTEPGESVAYLSDLRLTGIRDCAIGSENGVLVRAFRLLVEGYSLFDVRNGPDLRGHANVIEHSLVRLIRMPGGHQHPSTSSHHHHIYKRDANSPRLHAIGTTFAVEDPEGASLPEGIYEDTRLLWLGEGPYPGEQRPGVEYANVDGDGRPGAWSLWERERAALVG